MSDVYDVIVVGGGPAGYVAAIRCAQLGLRVACVDDQVGADGNASLGGTCLNVGCIPSKALLDSSEQFHRLNHQFAAHGISAQNIAMNVGTMLARKDKIVAKLTGGIAMLFKANKVESIHGHGQLLKDRTLAVRDPAGVKVGGDNARRLSAKHIILAPGSLPVELPGLRFDHARVVDSSGALNFDHVPTRIGIIGAGVIGLELGSVWRRLGAEVVILEALDDFLALADRQIAQEAARRFKQQGLDIRLGATLQKAEVAGQGVQLEYRQKNETHTLEVERVIVAVGRRPATDGVLGAECGVSLDQRGFIEVDDHCRTGAENIWAIGDAVRGPMLAHKGSEEGVAVAERIAAGAGRIAAGSERIAAGSEGIAAGSEGAGHVDFNTVPWVIYTAPEIAWVGRTEQQLKAQGVPYRTGAFPFAATGRALAMHEPVGMVKIIAHEKTDRLLGVHIIGPHASELIAECVLAMEFSASSEDLARTIHAHPTLSEAVHEAALAVDKRAIHKAG